MLVLQSCTDSLQVLPGSSPETFLTSSDGTCHVGHGGLRYARGGGGGECENGEDNS